MNNREWKEKDVVKKKLDKEFFSLNKHQEILFVGSRLFTILETIGIWLHVIAFAAGILAITGLAEGFEKAAHVLEILTLVIVGLIIVQFILIPIIKKIYLKKLLKDFWGDTKIATSLKYPLEIDTLSKFGTITKSADSMQLENTRIKWHVGSWFPFKKVLTIQQWSKVTSSGWKKYKAIDGTFNQVIVPIYMIVDVKSKAIKFQGRANILYVKKNVEIPEKRVSFSFNYVDKIANWSGIFPEHPMYGEWIWDSELSEKLESKVGAKKNLQIKTNKEVEKAFIEYEQYRNSHPIASHNHKLSNHRKHRHNKRKKHN